MRTRTALAVLASLLWFAASAQAHARHRTHHPLRCRSGFTRETVRVPERRHGRIVRRHHRIVFVRVERCERRRTVKPATPDPVTLPAPPTSTPAPAPASVLPVVRASIDPSYTQDPTDNLKVTWTYSASAGTSAALPTGTLSLNVTEPGHVGSSGGCTMNVTAAVTGGTCTQELPNYGAWNVTVSYTGASTTVAPASSTDTETIEPLPATVAYVWGRDQGTANPTGAANVIGHSASVTIHDADFEGATSVGVTDGLGDSCTAAVSGQTATCQMTLAGGPPQHFTLAYPGGTTSTGTRGTNGGGVQQVTYTWPAQTVQIASPTVTVQQAVLDECGGQQQGGPSWPGSGGGCTVANDGTVTTNQWPDPVTVGTGLRVYFEAGAYGSLLSDKYPAGYLTFTTSGPAAPSTVWDLGGDGGSDCSKSANSGGRAVGGCMYTFSTVGTYTLTVTFTSTDPNYASGPNTLSETINVQ